MNPNTRPSISKIYSVLQTPLTVAIAFGCVVGTIFGFYQMIWETNPVRATSKLSLMRLTELGIQKKSKDAKSMSQDPPDEMRLVVQYLNSTDFRGDLVELLATSKPDLILDYAGVERMLYVIGVAPQELALTLQEGGRDEVVKTIARYFRFITTPDGTLVIEATSTDANLSKLLSSVAANLLEAQGHGAIKLVASSVDPAPEAKLSYFPAFILKGFSLGSVAGMFFALFYSFLIRESNTQQDLSFAQLIKGKDASGFLVDQDGEANLREHITA